MTEAFRMTSGKEGCDWGERETTRVSQKGQTTIPKEIRERLGIESSGTTRGSRSRFGGRVRTRRRRRSFRTTCRVAGGRPSPRRWSVTSKRCAGRTGTSQTRNTATYTADAVSMLRRLVGREPDRVEAIFDRTERGLDSIETTPTQIAEVAWAVRQNERVAGR